MTMSLSSLDVNNEKESFSDENDVSHSYEIFFSGSDTEEEDGLVYKDIMIEGEWAYRPGPGQKPQPVPLKVVSGYAEEDNEIGMSDLIDAFNDGAIDHVTIPTSHDDKPHENTGYVKVLEIVDRGDKKALRAGLDFTEPDIKGKATRGSIANTSAGIIFDYIKKDTGKKFRQVLGHVALTNKPWLNGMKPFGVNASEDSEHEITPLVLADVIWNNSESFTWIREELTKQLNSGLSGEEYGVADVSNGKALIGKFDNSGNIDNYVVPFTITDENTLKVSDSESWIKASKEWVETALSQDKAISNSLGDASSLSEEAPNGDDPPKSNDGGKDMGSEVKEKEEETVGAPSDDSAQTGLSEDAIKASIKEELEAKFSEQREADAKEKEELRAKVRTMEVDKRVEELKGIGFSSQPGLLDEIRNIMLADKGSKVLTLSEDDSDVSLTATDIVDRIVEKMPKTEAGQVKFGEQALAVDSQEEPPATPETKLSEEERTQAMADSLGIKLPKDGDA